MRRSLAAIVLMVLFGGIAAPVTCAGWEVSASDRMACCQRAQHDSCDEQSAADDCCAAQEQSRSQGRPSAGTSRCARPGRRALHSRFRLERHRTLRRRALRARRGAPPARPSRIPRSPASHLIPRSRSSIPVDGTVCRPLADMRVPAETRRAGDEQMQFEYSTRVRVMVATAAASALSSVVHTAPGTARCSAPRRRRSAKGRGSSTRRGWASVMEGPGGCGRSAAQHDQLRDHAEGADLRARCQSRWVRAARCRRAG